ncbi:MAG: haloalkane dehalogenase [Pseudomonadales bacterium]
MQVLKSEGEVLDKIDGYPFSANFQEVPTENGVSVRIHYVDEGPKEGQPIVLLHGNPTWSYSYRKVIPILAAAGYRVLAPDLVGLGRSDKPTALSDYSIARHISWLEHWFNLLDLENVTLVCQDWGGMIGLSLASKDHTRFSGILVTNTGVYHENVMTKEQMQHIEKWAELARSSPDFPFEANLQGMINRKLTETELAAYLSPYSVPESRCGLRSFPSFIPVIPSGKEAKVECLRTWERLRDWHKPMLIAYSDGDPLTAPFAKVFKSRVPGTQGEAHITIKGGAHNVQEDRPQALAEVTLKFAVRCSQRT